MSDPLRAYVAENRDRYTRDAIRDRLLEAGYEPESVDAALAEAYAEPKTPSAVGRDRRWLAGAWVVILFLGTFVLFMATDMPQRTYGIGPAVLGVLLTIGSMISLVVINANRDLAEGITSGLLVGLLIPFIIAVAIAGLCVFTTAPSF